MTDRVAKWCVYLQTKTANMGIFFDGVEMEIIGIFYGHF
jgi:hypothetical protein